jgi:hypothetical protein
MTKTKAIKELRRVVKRLKEYPMLKGCISDSCGGRTKAANKCIFCDADHVLKFSARDLS